MEITSVNVNCLEKIFKYLNYDDLLNVAEANLHLREIAIVVYRLKYGRVKVFIQDIRISVIRLLEYTDRCGKRVDIGDLKTSFKLLRYFGSSISNLSVSQPDGDPRYTPEFYNISYTRLLTYINQYCSESLTRITFRGTFGLDLEVNNSLVQFYEPFMRVHSIEIGRGFNFNRNFLWLFPNIQNLYYNISNFDDFEYIRLASINHHFAHLDCLEIGFDRGNFSKLKMTDPKCMQLVPILSSVLRLNPQVQTLVTPFFMDEPFLRGLESLELLKNLSFVRSPANFANFNGRFSNLKRFYVCYEKHEFANRMGLAQMQIEQLEEFSCYILKESDHEFYDFVSRCPSIVKLKLCTVYAFANEITPMYLANALPKLSEIDFRKCNFTIKNPISFIRTIKSLNKFSFRLEQDPEDQNYVNIQKNLLNGWHVSKHRQNYHFDSHFVKLERKN